MTALWVTDYGLNFKQYQNYRKASYQFSDSHTEGSTTDVLFWNSKESRKKSKNGDTDYEKLEKFFKETNGEIYITSATCQLYTMKLNDVAFEFQDGFKTALRNLHFASARSTDETTAKNLFARVGGK